jgi:hypothetical protein
MSESPTKLKALDWEDALKNGIEGKSGKRYHFESELSVRRYGEAMKYRVYMAYGLPGIEELHQKLEKVADLINQARFFDAVTILNELLNGSQQLAQKFYPGLMLTAIYFNSDDEDRMGFSETEMKKKIEDWEHYGMSGFFTLAFWLLGIQAKSLEAITPTSLQREETSVQEVLEKNSDK